MKRFARRTALVTLIWLTAASTLLAGIPSFECVCPGRSRESSPSKVKAKGTGGGCDGGGCCCCASEPQSDPTRTSPERGGKHGCCPQEGPQPLPDSPKPTRGGPAKDPSGQPGHQSDKAAVAPELKQPRCAKTLAPSGGDDVAVAKTDSAGLPAPELLAPAAASQVIAPAPYASPCQLPWLPSHVPPPTDLVITLQHFLI
jgi:hypothetical protein